MHGHPCTPRLSSAFPGSALPSSLTPCPHGRVELLAELYAALNMTDAKHKASFDYLRMLLNHKDAKLRVGYSPLITAPAP